MREALRDRTIIIFLMYDISDSHGLLPFIKSFSQIIFDGRRNSRSDFKFIITWERKQSYVKNNNYLMHILH